MNELIKITTNAQGSQVVSARGLHEFLEAKTEFPKWCSRMFEYGFSENEDYMQVVVKNDDNSKGGKSTLIDYALTIDTAKEIAMGDKEGFIDWYVWKNDLGAKGLKVYADKDYKIRNDKDMYNFLQMLPPF